jgi:hypothetical protein
LQLLSAYQQYAMNVGAINQRALKASQDALADKGVDVYFDRQKALSEEERRLQSKIRETLTAAELSAARLTRDLQWRVGEVLQLRFPDGKSSEE